MRRTWPQQCPQPVSGRCPAAAGLLQCLGVASGDLRAALVLAEFGHPLGLPCPEGFWVPHPRGEGRGGEGSGADQMPPDRCSVETDAAGCRCNEIHKHRGLLKQTPAPPHG